MSKRIFSMLTLGVAAVAVAGFSMPAEGGLFRFFRHHHSGYSADCGYGGSCGYVDSGACPPACAPAPYRAFSPPPVSYPDCAYPPPRLCGYDARGYDYDDDDDCDDDD